jgi:hypothetical protein
MTHKTFLQDEEFEGLETLQLMEILKNGLLFQRGRALFELARRSGKEEKLIEMIVGQIVDEKNQQSRTVGIASISFLGIAGLLTANTSNTREVARKLINDWSEPDRTNLLEFIKSASLTPD